MAEREVIIYVKLRDAAIKQLNKLKARTKMVGSAFVRFGIRASAAIKKIIFGIRTMRSVLERYGKYVLLLGTYFMARWVKNSVKAIIEVGAKYEQLFNRILIASRGVRADAEKTWKKILHFAARTPLMTGKVVAAFVTLKAAGVKNAFEITKALGGLALMFGRQIDDLAGMFLGALQRVFRRMGIIIDRSGKRAIIQTAAWKVEVDKDIRSIWAGLAEVIQKSFGEALGLAENTWRGAVLTMLGLWDIFLNKIAAAGILDWLTAALKVVIDQMERLLDVGEIDKIAKQISDRLVIVFKLSAGIVENFYKWRQGALAIQITALGIQGIFNAIVMGPLLFWQKTLVIIYKGIRSIFELLAKVGKAFSGIIEKTITWAKKIPKLKDFVPDLEGFRELLEGIAVPDIINDLVLEGERMGAILKDQILNPWKKIKELEEEIAKIEAEIADWRQKHGTLLGAIEKKIKHLADLQKQRAEEGERLAYVAWLQSEMTRKLEALDKKRIEHLKQQKALKESLNILGNEEMAKMRWIIDNSHLVTAEMLAQNEEMRKTIMGSDDLVRIFQSELRQAVEQTMGPLQAGLMQLGRERGITTLPSQMPARVEQERERIINRMIESLGRIAGGQIPLRLDADIDLMNNPTVQVGINLATETISGTMHKIISEQIKTLEMKLNERFEIEDKAPRARDIEFTQISGVQ